MDCKKTKIGSACKISLEQLIDHYTNDMRSKQGCKNGSAIKQYFYNILEVLSHSSSAYFTAVKCNRFRLNRTKFIRSFPLLS